MTDAYSESAEFIDLLIAPFWEQMRPTIRAVLVAVTTATTPTTATPPTTLTAVDIGAGSGQGTLTLAHALPTARIIAVEPSATLRCALLARANSDDDLRRRITVRPTGFPEVELPSHFNALIAMNVIGHFDEDVRGRLWSVLAERLSVGGVALVNVQDAREAEYAGESLMSEAQVGSLTYQVYGSVEASDGEMARWKVRYLTMEDATLLDERTVSYASYILSPERLTAETEAAGLVATPTGDPDFGIFTIVRHQPR